MMRQNLPCDDYGVSVNAVAQDGASRRARYAREHRDWGFSGGSEWG